MDTISYKTKSANAKTVTHKWVVIDVEGQVLGRVTSKIASLLKGKHKPYFTPHVDCGDHVIVINAGKVTLTGKKWTDKEIISYSGYPGGQKVVSPKNLVAKKPHALIEHAVRGMLPKSKLGHEMFRKLHVYPGSDHPHQIQKPEKITL